MVESTATLVSGKLLDADFMSRALIVSGLRPGFFCNSRATAPETTGVAMLVPLSRKYWPVPGFVEVVYSDAARTFDGYKPCKVDPGASSEATRFPGATTSGFTVKSI